MQFATKFRPPEKISTHGDGASVTDASKLAETDIYALIHKYGIQSLMYKNKPEQELYIDTTILPQHMTRAEAMQQLNSFKEYFAKAPARFRKLFGDNPDEFYQAYRQGDFDKLIETGALTREQVEIQKEAIKAEMQPIKDKITEYENLLKEEKSRNERLNAIINAQQDTQSNQIS